MKWSPPHNRQGYLDFLFPLLSFSGAIGLGFSCWFPGFLFLPFPFFLLPDDCVLWIAFTSTKTIGLEGTGVEVLGCLAALTVDGGWIEPIKPSTGVYASGLVGSVLGRGAWGMRSYKVPDWEYTKSRYYAWLMACSSVTTPPIATSRAMGGNKDFVNQLSKSWSGIGALTSLLHLLHSWMWSDMCVEAFWRREVKSSLPVS